MGCDFICLCLLGNLKEEKILLRRFQLEELGKATKNFSKDCLLGCGAFGNVYKGTFDDLGPLAIKRTHADSFQSAEEFRNGEPEPIYNNVSHIRRD